MPSADERMGARKIFEGAVWRLGQLGRLGRLGQVGMDRDFSAATNSMLLYAACCCMLLWVCGGFKASGDVASFGCRFASGVGLQVSSQKVFYPFLHVAAATTIYRFWKILEDSCM